MGNEIEKETIDAKALVKRKLSQKRIKMLLQISEEMADTVKTAEGGLIEKYRNVSEEIDRLIIEEAKFQEQTMPKE